MIRGVPGKLTYHICKSREVPGTRRKKSESMVVCVEEGKVRGWLQRQKKFENLTLGPQRFSFSEQTSRKHMKVVAAVSFPEHSLHRHNEPTFEAGQAVQFVPA